MLSAYGEVVRRARGFLWDSLITRPTQTYSSSENSAGSIGE